MRAEIRQLLRIADATITRSRELVADVKWWLDGRPTPPQTPPEPASGDIVRPMSHTSRTPLNDALDERDSLRSDYVPAWAVPEAKKTKGSDSGEAG